MPLSPSSSVAEHYIGLLTYISSPAFSTSLLSRRQYHPTGIIVETEAKTSSSLLRRQVALHEDNTRNLQGGPKHPDLKIVSTVGGTITASAAFFQGGDRYIRVFKNDCITKFFPNVDFTVGDASSIDSEWTENGSAGDTVNFVIPLKHLNGHLDNTDGGKVDVCIQLETVSTFSNTRVPVELDLTHTATAISVNAKQPAAVQMQGIDINTQVNAWVCAGNDADPAFTDTKINELEVPGKIFVCIEVNDGYAIRSGKLVADAAQTQGDDKTIVNYMDDTVLATGLTGVYNTADTIQILKPNLVRVSIMGDRNWAPVLASNTLTITIDAYFEPDAGRRLASPRHLAKFQPGSLRIKNTKKEKFASAFTTVQLRAASDTGPQSTSGVGPAPTSGVISDDATPTNESKTNIAVIAGAAGASAFVAVAVAFLLVSRKRRQSEESNERVIAALDTTDKDSLDPTTRSSIRSSVSSSNASDHEASKVSGNPNARGPPRRPPQGCQRDPPRLPPQGSPRDPPHRNDGSIPNGAPRGASPRHPNGPPQRPHGPPRGRNNRPTRFPAPTNGGRPSPPRGKNGCATAPPQGHLRSKTPPPY